MITLWIVIAGTIGCSARWAIEEVVERQVMRYRPYATMGVNILGAIVTGYVVYASKGPFVSLAQFDQFRQHTEPILLTGFCGGFTTFSSALAIPYLEWRRGSRLRATVLVGATPLLCVAGYGLGELVAHL